MYKIKFSYGYIKNKAILRENNILKLFYQNLNLILYRKN